MSVELLSNLFFIVWVCFNLSLQLGFIYGIVHAISLPQNLRMWLISCLLDAKQIKQKQISKWFRLKQQLHVTKLDSRCDDDKNYWIKRGSLNTNRNFWRYSLKIIALKSHFSTSLRAHMFLKQRFKNMMLNTRLIVAEIPRKIHKNFSQ